MQKYFRWYGHVARMDHSRWAYRTASWLSLRSKKSGALSQNWNCYNKSHAWKLRGVGKTNKYTCDKLLHCLQEKSDWANGNWWPLGLDRLEWTKLEYDFVQMHFPPRKTQITSDLDKQAAECGAMQKATNPFHCFME